MIQVVKLFVYFIYIGFSILFLYYLYLPSLELPPPLPGSAKSREPADLAFTYRPAYFTHSNRQQTMDHYTSHFSLVFFDDFRLKGYRLNYPPEEVSIWVRPHVYSSYLEEIVYPFRESLFINGFRPTQAKDAIWHDGVNYDEKIILKHVTSSVYVRIILGISSLAMLVLIIRELIDVFKTLVKNMRIETSLSVAE